MSEVVKAPDGGNYDYKTWLEMQPLPVTAQQLAVAQAQTTVPADVQEPNYIMRGNPNL